MHSFQCLCTIEKTGTSSIAYIALGMRGAMNHTTYVITTEEKLKVKLLTENLRRVLYTSMILAIGIPIMFMLYLFFTVPENVRLVFYGVFIGFELVAIAYFVLATNAIDRKSFRMIEFAVYSFWAFVSLFGFGLSYILYLAYADMTMYYLVLAAVTMITIMPAKDMTVYMVAQGIFALVMIFTLQMTPYQMLGIAMANGIFILLSRVLYKSQASAYEMKQRMVTMSKDAEEDPLTGLLNRRGLDRHLATIWPYCIRNHNMVAVIIIDIDNFKIFNDTFGHPEGDKCLKQVAGAIQRSARRSTDISARIGGEEFLVFVHGTDEMEPVKLAEKIRTTVEKLSIPQSPALASSFVTVSIGVAATIPTDETGFSKLYNEADKALYYAKKNGRNVIVYGSKVYGRRVMKAE